MIHSHIARLFITAAVTLILSSSVTGEEMSFGKISAAVGAKPKSDWTYDVNAPTGPHSWQQSHQSCRGSRQSPVDIETDELGERFYECQAPVALSLKNYDMEQYGTVENDGLHVKFVPKRSYLKLSSSFLDTDYALEEVKFHWGNHSHSGGSEHLVNGKRLPMEIQFLHNPDKRRPEFQSKVILSVLAELTLEDNPALSDIISAFPYIYQPSEEKSLKTPISLRNILPPSTAFYYYRGSQTTPPCDENVHWMIMQDTIGVSEGQLLAFRSLYADSPSLINNYRPVQQLGDRKVHRSCLAELQPPSTTLSLPTTFISSRRPKEDGDKGDHQNDDPKSTLPRGAPKTLSNGQDTSATQRPRLTTKAIGFLPPSINASNLQSYGSLAMLILCGLALLL